MAGYLRTGPAGGRREPGSRGASLVFRACVSGGAGPWRASRAAAPRLLLDLLGPGTEAGRAGRPGRVPRLGAIRIALTAANSVAAFFKNRIQLLPVAASERSWANGGGDRRRLRG